MSGHELIEAECIRDIRGARQGEADKAQVFVECMTHIKEEKKECQYINWS